MAEGQKKEDSSISKLKQRVERKRSYYQTTFKAWTRRTVSPFKHTVEVLKNLVDAIEALEVGENESATNYANYMKQGKLLFLEDRIQMLRLADREGWTVVKLYKQNILVSNWELSEKQLKQARKSAERIKQNIEIEQRETNMSTRLDDVKCYNCKKVGHYSTYFLLCKNNSHKFLFLSKNSSTTTSSSRHNSSNSSSSRSKSRRNKWLTDIMNKTKTLYYTV